MYVKILNFWAKKSVYLFMSNVEECSMINPTSMVSRYVRALSPCRIHLRIMRKIPAKPFRVPRIEMTVEVDDRHSTESIIC